MKKRAPVNRLATFLVILLLVMLPVSVSAQLGLITNSTDPGTQQPNAKLVQQEYSYLSQGDVEPELFCKSDEVNCWKFLGLCKKKWECDSAIWCGFGYKYCSSSSAKIHCYNSNPVCCSSSAKYCSGGCYNDCPSGQIWNCGSSGAYCTNPCTDKDGDGYGSGCSKGSDCNDNDANVNPGKSEACGDGKDNDCDGQTDEGCCAGNRQCNGICWGPCQNSADTWHCVSTGGMCCSPDSQWCGGFCWKACPSGQTWSCGSDGKGHCTASCTDKDSDGYGSGCSKGSDCNDNDAGVYKNNVCGVCAKEPSGYGNYGKSCTACNGACCATSAYNCNSAKTGLECPVTPKSPTTETCNSIDDDCDGLVDENVKNACGGCGAVPSETCGDGKDNNCNGQIDENCCPSSKPYLWSGQCNECPQDKQKKCGSTCYSGGECGSEVTVCDKNNNVACCPKDWPYYCSRTDGCWQSSAQCSSAQKCGSEYSNCLDQKYPNWNCRPNGKAVCCQAGSPYWWESDKQCHSSKEQEKCAVPDGSSAACTCFSNSDCPSSKPYCENNYPSPTSDGYDACLSSPPEYCGNGKCSGSENYNSCAADCGQNAPKGTITTSVVYQTGSHKDKPIQGAYAYLDGVSKGTTDSNGKLKFEAAYGSRTVKVECPDNTFCDSKTVHVDGDKFSSVRCTCNPPGDFDGDGYSDDDEKLLGTDPKDAKSSFGTTFGSDSVDLVACLPTPVTLLIIWKETIKKGGNIIQANSIVLQALNVTSVTSASVEEKPYVVADAISKSDLRLQAEIVTATNVTLESAVKAAEYVDGIYTQNELLLIATDRETGTTAIIVIGAGCLGAFSGAIYGIGQGIVDDVKGIVEGIWFVITHLGEITKIGDAAKDLVTEVVELLKSPGETVWTLFRSVLDKGKGINIFREGRLDNKEAYRRFQVGFVYGFVTGYVTEQVALGAIILTKVAKAFKIGQLLGKTGKAVKLSEKLALIRNSEEFGAEIAEKLGKLKYLKEGIDNWLDSEIKGLARIVKHNEGWLKGLSEAEAKVAAKNIDNLATVRKVADADIENLLKTKLGQRTLKSADATTDLLAKQSKLVSKWGVKKADDVISKGGRLAERTADLNKILKAMPEGIVDDFSPEKAVKFLGDKKLVSAAEDITKGVDNAAIGRVVSDIGGYEKLLEYAKAVKKLDPAIANPLGDIGQHQLLKVMKNAKLRTKVGDTSMDGFAVLRKGVPGEKGWGWDHISKTRPDGVNHAEQIKKALGLADADDSVKNVIADVIQNPDSVTHVSGDLWKVVKGYNTPNGLKKIQVVVSDVDDPVNKVFSRGSVQTAHPI